MATAPKNAAAKADQAKKSYEVISPLNHDQADYAIGETVELTEAEAESLLGHTVKAIATKAKD